MKVFRAVVIVIGVLIVLAVVAACLMPNTFSVRRSRVIVADAGTLYAKFATPRTWAEWSTWTSRGDSTLHYSYEGPDSGVGAAMKWTSKKFGDGKLTIATCTSMGTCRSSPPRAAPTSPGTTRATSGPTRCGDCSAR